MEALRWLKFISKNVPALLFLAALQLSSRHAAGQSVYTEAYTFTTFAGKPAVGSDDGVGSDAQFNGLTGVAVDAQGNVFIADSGNSVIRMMTPAGVVTTIAGFPGNAGTADGMNSLARFNDPVSIVVDPSDNLFVSDSRNFTIREISHAGTNWVVSTIAGQPGIDGYVDGTNDNAAFGAIGHEEAPGGGSGPAIYEGPRGITLDGQGNLYVADYGNSAIRKVSPAGTNWVVTTVVNFGSTQNLNFSFPQGICIDGAGNLYAASGSGAIFKVTPQGTNWQLALFAGQIETSGSQDGTGANARFANPSAIVVDAATNLYVADAFNDNIRKITPDAVVTTFAGFAESAGSMDAIGTNAQFSSPGGLAVDNSGNLYVGDTGNEEVREVTPLGVVSTLAGSVNSQGSINGVGTGALFFGPRGVTTDANGNIFVADSGNSIIRRITPAGRVTTVAGSTNAGNADGVAVNAQFNQPLGLAVDSSGNIYVADTGNTTIRKITSNGTVTTIAGSTNVGSVDGTGTNAGFEEPFAIAVDKQTNLYVADFGSIRKMTLVGANWNVKTIGSGFGIMEGLALDGLTNIYVTAEFAVGRFPHQGHDSIVGEFSPVGTNWVANTLAGGADGSSDGLDTAAGFDSPTGIAVDSGGNLYVSDSGNSTIRKISPVGTNWSVSTIGGQIGVIDGQDGTGLEALFNSPTGITVDSAGNIYIADTGNNTIRKGVFTQFGSANLAAYSAPPQTGALQVTLLPPEANGQWRFPWEVAWHNSGFTATNLAPGNYPVEFRNLPGWLAIPPELSTSNAVAINAGSTTQITNSYYQTSLPSDASGAAGSLTVYLGANPPAGAGWRFLGDTTPFLPSNFTTNLAAGTYLIEFAGPFTGRATPSKLSVQVPAGQSTLVSVTYPFAAAPPSNVLLPTPVPPNQINDLADYPFGFNGQVQTDVGFGSGVVVQTNVVLTAAHLVFNDQTLSYVSGAYFFLQEEIPSYAPTPQIAEGWYVLSGYAAQRTNDLADGFVAGQSSPDSRNNDVAALYFNGPVANGGYAGYLPSDEVPNQWLSGNAEKILVGYPVDGSLYGFADVTNGDMYEIGPQPYSLSLSADSVTNQQQVYTASWFLAYPGNSGGPLYVQLNGTYYPAGIYLGTLNNQSVVRAIDSVVTNLILQAATLGDAGANHNGGGVVVFVANSAIGLNNPAYLQVQLGPPSAVAAGAGWKLQSDTSYASSPGFTRAVTSTSANVVFNPIPGWNLPTNQSISLTPGLISSPTAFYTVLPPKLVFNAQGIGLSGTTNTTYRIEKTTSLNNPVWTGISTNMILNPNFNLVVPRTNQTTTFYRAVWLNK